MYIYIYIYIYIEREREIYTLYIKIYIYVCTVYNSIYIDNFKEKGGHIIIFITLLSHYYIFIGIYIYIYKCNNVTIM